MANYLPVIKPILKYEAGLADDPDDNGGLTWQGVAYNFYPNWPGWKIVFKIMSLNPKSVALWDKGKGDGSKINAALFAQKDLSELVLLFFKKLYWDVNKLDSFVSEQLAANVCDCGVNCGVTTAAKMLQRAYNKVSKTLKLDDDGKIGSKTITAINNDDPEALYNTYNVLRKAYYDAIIKRDPSQVKFKKSWYNRIKPYK